MRHTIPIFAVLIILIGCGKGDEENSNLFDPNNAGHVKIEAKVRIKTRKKTGDFTKDDLIKMISLNLPNSQIDDLTPLASMGQLQIVILNNNQITDLKPLSGLTRLKQLNLANNKITDLTPLQTLKGLGDGELNLSNNPGLTKAEIDRFMKEMPYNAFQRTITLIHNAK